MTYRKILPVLFHISFVFAIVLSSYSPAYAQDSTAVEKHGQLRIQGNKMVDKNGNPVILRGMCLYWSQWKGQFYNAECVDWLINDWNCNVVRASMGVENGGYLTNPSVEKAKIKAVIDACISLGIYVIVDWHEENAQKHVSQSVAFFEEIARDYGDTPNLIYEIFNEPLMVSWTSSIKPYADTVVSHIRAIDPDNIIVVGTPTWSQYVDEAATNPLSFNNIAYSLHFYAATAAHKQTLRDRAANALSKGAALFVTEFGTCESSGSGKLDSTETTTWLNFLEQNKISWCNWSIADLTETSAALNPGASGTGGWANSVLKPSGLFIRQKIRIGNSSIATSVGSSTELPIRFGLNQNYPNPFNPTTMISFQLPMLSKVRLTVYDVLGREKATLVDEVASAGVHKVEWNASALSSGVYFYTLQAGNSVEAKKLMVLK
jgi:endoglucanase